MKYKDLQKEAGLIVIMLKLKKHHILMSKYFGSDARMIAHRSDVWAPIGN